MLNLALSCYQGLSMSEAYDRLMKFDISGIQLTPGNHPTNDFKSYIKIPYRLHHTFSFTKMIGRIYDTNFKLIDFDITDEHSIHPPKVSQTTSSFDEWLSNIPVNVILELMHGPYHCSDEKSINAVLDRRQAIAVDISHMHICNTQKTISNNTLKRVLNYDNIKEIHFSHNGGKFDTHHPMNINTPYLSWAKSHSDIPWIFESNLKKSSYDEVMFQLDLIR